MTKYRWQSQTRYYLAFIYQDLFGDWIVHRVWGGLFNALGSSKYEVHPDRMAAEKSIQKIKTARKSHQYEPILNEGDHHGLARL